MSKESNEWRHCDAINMLLFSGSSYLLVSEIRSVQVRSVHAEFLSAGYLLHSAATQMLDQDLISEAVVTSASVLLSENLLKIPFPKRPGQYTRAGVLPVDIACKG